MTALTGREEEFKTIEDCVQRWISEDASMCLFVNGVPGTGKTATVSAVVNKFHHTSPAKSKGRKRKVDSSVSDLSIKLKNWLFLVQIRLYQLSWLE